MSPNPPPKTPGPDWEIAVPDAINLYQLFRDYAKHEDELMHRRVTWNITVQSFLIATFGFGYQKKLEVAASIFLDPAKAGRYADNLDMHTAVFETNVVLICLCLIGAVAGFFTTRAVGAAKLALDGLHDKWRETERYYSPHNPFISRLPVLIGGGPRLTSAKSFGTSNWSSYFFLWFWVAALALVVLDTFHGLHMDFTRMSPR